MKDWDIAHRPSNMCLHHDRADTAIRSSKKILKDCVSRAGSIDNDKFMKATILQYRNMPHQDCKRSSAQMVFGRTLKITFPASLTNTQPMLISVYHRN